MTRQFLCKKAKKALRSLPLLLVLTLFPVAASSADQPRIAETPVKYGPKVGGDPVLNAAQRMRPAGAVFRRSSRSIDTTDGGELATRLPPVSSPTPPEPPSDSNPSSAPDAASQLAAKLEVRALEGRLQLAKHRIEALQRQANRFTEYDRFGSPHTLSMVPARAVPTSFSYEPLTFVGFGPVASFRPRSSFSHVLYESERRLHDARLELQALAEVKQRLETEGLHSIATSAGAPQVQLREISAQLEIERFRAESARLRELQFERWTVAGGLRPDSRPRRISPVQITNLGRRVYPELTDDLWSKIRLRRLEHDILVSTLKDQELLIRRHLETASHAPPLQQVVEHPSARPSP